MHLLELVKIGGIEKKGSSLEIWNPPKKPDL